LELEAPYEIDKASGHTTHGWDNIDVGARYPLFEAVAPSEFADTTFGIALEIEAPLNTVFSRNTELVPKIFNDTKIGNFTIQSIFGYSMLFGAGGDDDSFYCDCHWSNFDPAGKVTQGPADRDLPVFQSMTSATGHLMVTMTV
jgi:hypothetical protein